MYLGRSVFPFLFQMFSLLLFIIFCFPFYFDERKIAEKFWTYSMSKETNRKPSPEKMALLELPTATKSSIPATERCLRTTAGFIQGCWAEGVFIVHSHFPPSLLCFLPSSLPSLLSSLLSFFSNLSFSLPFHKQLWWGKIVIRCVRNTSH